MSMQVDVKVNGKSVRTLHILNVGHPVEGGHPKDDDLRLYRWEGRDSRGRRLSGEVKHHQDAGAAELAGRVLLQLRSQEKEIDGHYET